MQLQAGKYMPNSWSDKLKKETRDALHDCFFAPDEFLHMKNINGNFGKIHRDDLIAGKWSIQDKMDDAVYTYVTTDELIEDGWAID